MECSEVRVCTPICGVIGKQLGKQVPVSLTCGSQHLERLPRVLSSARGNASLVQHLAETAVEQNASSPIASRLRLDERHRQTRGADLVRLQKSKSSAPGFTWEQRGRAPSTNYIAVSLAKTRFVTATSTREQGSGGGNPVRLVGSSTATTSLSIVGSARTNASIKDLFDLAMTRDAASSLRRFGSMDEVYSTLRLSVLGDLGDDASALDQQSEARSLLQPSSELLASICAVLWFCWVVGAWFDYANANGIEISWQERYGLVDNLLMICGTTAGVRGVVLRWMRRILG
jgi:hypothetical protein